ncbi:MAG: SBBP repeat-containing protein [Deltaproteobacteria bacterium]|nr:SBBP repeat-containing protein [Deltaproteobacteria bacterium]
MVKSCVASCSLVTLSLACAGSPVVGGAGEPCGSGGECAPGTLCVDGLCLQLCAGDTQCPKSQACDQGTCKVINHDCDADGDCAAPALCEIADGAYCRAGQCHYAAAMVGSSCDDGDACTKNKHCDAQQQCRGEPAVMCDQVPEPQCAAPGVARIYTGTCQNGECTYAPSTVTCTTCPATLDCLAGCLLDINADGVADAVGAGAIAQESGCLVCDPAVSVSNWSPYQCEQPSPPNVCRALTGTCDTSLAGGTCQGQFCCVFPPVGPADCTLFAPGDGVCVTVGASVSCLLDNGQGCGADDTLCASGHCADGVCCDSSCPGNCDRCNLAGSQGSCLPDADICTGDCDVCADDGSGFSCAPVETTCGGCGDCLGAAGGTHYACVPVQSCGDCSFCGGSGTSYECADDVADTDPRGDCLGLLACDGAGTCLGAWAGTKQLGTASFDSAQGLTVDAGGNVYAAVYTYGSFGGAAQGGTDAALTKHNFSGTNRWSRQLGGSADDWAEDVGVDASGNVYLAGTTTGSLGGTLQGVSDGIVVKYDSAGTWQWTRQLGTPNGTPPTAFGGDPVRAAAVDASGNVFLAGFTDGQFAGHTNQGGFDLYVAKYDTDGNWEWTRQAGTSGTDSAYGAAADADGNVVIAGSTSGTLGASSAGGTDLFVRKYNSAGVVQWTQQLGTALTDVAEDVTTDGVNVYVAGSTDGGLDGNADGSYKDIFVVKYDSAGTKQWTRQRASDDRPPPYCTDNEYGQDQAYAVAADATGNVYVAGTTEGCLDGVMNAGYGTDLFVIKYNTNGDWQWTRQRGTPNSEGVGGIATDSSGNVYVAGWTPGGLDGNVSAGGSDLFILKFDSDGNKQ